MMKKSTMAGFAVLAAGVVTLAAFQSAGTAPQAAAPVKKGGKVVTIQWAASPIAQTGVRADLISLFEKTHPNIKVQLISQSTNTDTNRASLITQITGGSVTPDVFMGDVVWPGQFASAGLALPLNGKVSQAFLNHFAKGLVAGASYKGKVYALPFFMDSGFLYYRKDLLTKAHLPVPKTWEQLVSDSKTLLKKKLVKYGFVWQGNSYEGLTCDWMEYLTDAGGQVFNAQGKAVMNSPAAVKALTFMRSLITSGVSPAAVSTYQEAQAMNAFNAGQAAFLRNWDYAWSNSQTPSQSKVVGKVGVVPLPTFAGKGGTGYATIGGWDLYVNPHTKHLQQDLTFIEWMTSNQAQTVLASKYSEIPTDAAVQNNPAVRALNPVLAIVNKTHLIARPSQTPNYALVSKDIYTNINAALAGQMSPKSALDTANSGLQSANSGSSL